MYRAHVLAQSIQLARRPALFAFSPVLAEAIVHAGRAYTRPCRGNGARDGTAGERRSGKWRILSIREPPQPRRCAFSRYLIALTLSPLDRCTAERREIFLSVKMASATKSESGVSVRNGRRFRGQFRERQVRSTRVDARVVFPSHSCPQRARLF